MIWVLGLQTGIDTVARALMALLIMGLAGWIYGRWGHLGIPRTKRRTAQTIALILANINVVCGYLVTNRMLAMFKRKDRKQK